MHLPAVNMSLGKNKSEMKRNEIQQRHLEGNCLHLCSRAQPPPPPPLQPPLLMTTDSHWSGDISPDDKRPRDPPKDPTPRRRPSKASQLPLPFPLRSEAERVANVHTIFESALNQTRPSSQWIYDCFQTYLPHKSKEQLVYFSNVLCLAIAEFHLTSRCTPTGMCSPVLPQVVEVEMPPLETYLHGREVGMQDVHILSKAANKRLGAWLHRIDMTIRYDEARVNSPCDDDDHKLGALFDYFLMPENTGVSLEDIIGRVVVENVDTLEVRLVKGKKVLKEVTKAQAKLLTRVAKQKMAQEKSQPTRTAHQEATQALRQVTEQLD